MGESNTASQHLSRAVSLRGDGASRKLLSMWNAVRANPSSAIDRDVKAAELLDHERPMWEAFETPAQPGR